LAITNVCRRPWHNGFQQGRDNLSVHLAAALRQLPLLRQLELSDPEFKSTSVDDTALAAISSLTNLQALSVEGFTRTSPAGYAALPASLTLLEFKQMWHLHIMGSAADCLAALTRLQHLQLQGIGDVSLTAIGALTQLTHLHLQRLHWKRDQAMQLLQQLLSALAGLQQLRHLHASLAVYLLNRASEPAMQWTALVASTQLTYLHLTGVDWRPGDCATMSCKAAPSG
jgi:hypothetical protein